MENNKKLRNRIKNVDKVHSNKNFKCKGNEDESIPFKNDYAYYSIDDQISKDLASLPFNYINGTRFPLTVQFRQLDGAAGYKTQTDALASIMVLEYVNAVGKADKVTSGINMASTQLYTYVRHANSGARNYEAPDIMMYVLAMRDIYSDYFELRRALGLTKLYSFYNHNLPDLLIQSLGFNVKDLRANAANYRGQLNQIREKINSFAVPKYFKMFERAAYVASNVFSDSDSMRGQFYAMKRVGRYIWSGTTSQTGTELEYRTIQPTADQSYSMQRRIDELNEQLDAIFLDEDALTMSGDILKAFKESELYQVTNVSDDLAIVPLFDQDMLSQFENSFTFTPVAFEEDMPQGVYGGLNVRQNGQYITWQPYMKYRYGYNSVPEITENLVLNSHKNNPDYKDVLEYTRLMCTYHSVIEEKEETVGDDTNTYYEVTSLLDSCGCELGLSWSYYRYTLNNDNVAVAIVGRRFNQIVAFNTVDMDRITDISQFDWHPFIFIIDNAPDTEGTESLVRIFGDLKVATPINIQTLKHINDSAVYATVYARDLYRKG